jgi:hypothetical protein
MSSICVLKALRWGINPECQSATYLEYLSEPARAAAAATGSLRCSDVDRLDRAGSRARVVTEILRPVDRGWPFSLPFCLFALWFDVRSVSHRWNSSISAAGAASQPRIATVLPPHRRRRRRACGPRNYDSRAGRPYGGPCCL